MHRRLFVSTRIFLSQSSRYSKSAWMQCSGGEVGESIRTGLYGLPELRHPDDFVLLADQAITKCKGLQHDIDFHLGKDSPHETLLAIDDISNEICSVIDAAELCRQSHKDPKFRKCAELAFNHLSSFIDELNTESRLYDKLSDIMSSSEVEKRLSKEEVIFANDMMMEFEAEGVHIKENKDKTALGELKSQVLELESAFVRNITCPPSMATTFPLGPLSDDAYVGIKRWLDNQDLTQPTSTAHAETLPRGFLHMPADGRIARPLMVQLGDEKLRECLWRGVCEEPQANQQILGSLILNRQKLAHKLGYKSYAHKNLSRKVLTTPEEVSEMLTRLAAKSCPKASEQLAILSDLKKKLSGDSCRDTCREVYPWDVGHLTHIHSMQMSGGSGNNGKEKVSASNELREYLSLDTCMDGLKMVCKEVFGIEMDEVSVSQDEHWMCAGHKNTMENGHKAIRKFVLYAPPLNGSSYRGEQLGCIYLDPFARGYKFSGASHFTIRCGRRNDRVREVDPLSSSSSDGQNHQTPIVALLFDFPAPSPNAPALLSLSQLETLYHEWGHALHSLLSRTNFQHLSGTRGSTDFVEVPSHLFEYFGKSPEVIATWATHHSTGDKPSRDLIAAALMAEDQFAAIELQTQILYSLADQYAFGMEIVDGIDLSTYDSSRNSESAGQRFASSTVEERVYRRLLQGTAELQKQHTRLALPSTLSGTSGNKILSAANMLSHIHLANLGGTYYSYMFARMHAAQIWHTQFAKSPLNRTAGELLWDGMLQYGASKSPKEMLEKLGKGSLDPSYYLDDL